jgi:hypothetical protein
MSRDKSEFERGIESLGRALTGVTGRLLGPKAIGRETLPPESAISPEADETLAKVGDDLGKLLNAAGAALEAHPLDPAAAVREARAHTSDEVHPEEGWTPLAAGLVKLGGGLAKVAEGVLDVVAPKKPKEGAEGGGAEGEGAERAADAEDDDADEAPTRAP